MYNIKCNKYSSKYRKPKMNHTKDLIKAYYDNFNHQKIEAFLNLLTEDVIHDINQGGSEKGREAFHVFIQHMNRCYKETVQDLLIMVSEDGNRAAAEFVIEGTYIGTDKGLPEAKGQHYKLPCGAFFHIANGKISRVTNYYNINDWLKQVK